MNIPREVLSVADACDRQASRYAYGSVLFRRNGSDVTADATDGKVAISVTWSDTDLRYKDKSLSTLLNGEELRRAVKTIDNGKAREFPVAEQLSIGQRCVRAKLDRVSTFIPTTEGRFPNTDHVFNECAKRSNTIRICIDPTLVSCLLRIVASLGGPDSPRATLVIDADNPKESAILVECESRHKVRAAFMPCIRDGE